MIRLPLRIVLLAAALLSVSDATAQPGAVTLFEGPHLTGESLTVDRDIFDLNDTPFGARRTSSIEVARGCRVTLFERSGYRGQSQEFFERDNDLGNTRLGRQSVSSVRVDCKGGGGGGHRPRGVTLYRDEHLSGPFDTFSSDVSDLNGSHVGGGAASSIEVPSGCIAILYSEPDFRGRSTEFGGNNNKLRNTPVGNDQAWSIRVNCGGRPGGGHHEPERPASGAQGQPAGVTLFRDKNLRGSSELFGSDVPDLSRSRIGARSASSIRVPNGCRATLYSEPGFQGRSTTFGGDNNDLRNTDVGGDTVQSLRVECKRY
jgi:hypothetical protein